MPSSESLRRAGDGFRSVAVLIGPDQWDLPTPCDGWCVRELVGHVAAASQMAAVLADGGTRDDAIVTLGVNHLGDDPLAALTNALERQATALDRDGVDTEVLEHPAGDMPGSQVIAFRLGDLVAHQWDLARAIGADETLDAELVAEVWDGIQPMLPMMGAVGVFGEGPSGTLADDAPLQLRLLDAMGRRP